MKMERVKKAVVVGMCFWLLLGIAYIGNTSTDAENEHTQVSETESVKKDETEREQQETEAVQESEQAEVVETEKIEYEKIDDDLLLTQTEAFSAVVRNQKRFYYSNLTWGSLDSPDWRCYGYWEEVLEEKEHVLTEFTGVDLDGDGLGELVFAIENYEGFLIWRYDDGDVICYEVGYRSMNGLNREGFFGFSSGAEDNGSGKMFFIKDVIITDDIMERYYDRHYVKDIKVSEEVAEAVEVAVGQIDEVTWEPYTVQDVASYVWMTPLFAEAFEMIPPNEKQEYLDSLYYLIEMYRDETPESKQEFYYACLEEMDKIYDLCVEKYIDEELRVLQKRQRRWEMTLLEQMREDTGESLLDLSRLEGEDINWHGYGGTILKRICNLVNEYYECEFYKSPEFI